MPTSASSDGSSSARAASIQVIGIVGSPDHGQIAGLVRQVAPAAEVVIDLSTASGSYSTLLAACIQIASASGRQVAVRGCSQRFLTTIRQMRLSALLRVESSPCP